MIFFKTKVASESKYLKKPGVLPPFFLYFSLASSPHFYAFWNILCSFTALETQNLYMVAVIEKLWVKNVFRRSEGWPFAPAGIFSNSFGFSYPNSGSPQRVALQVNAQHWEGFYVDFSGYLKSLSFEKPWSQTTTTWLFRALHLFWGAVNGL